METLDMSKQATTVKSTYTAPVREPTDHLPLLDVSVLPKTGFWQTLGMALTLKRDYESATEAAYVAWLCNRLPVSMIDAAGNVHVDLRTLPEHRSMFTSHTDTVHSGGGINKVRVDGKKWRADKGAALGADDGVGNAIMVEMINANVPGYYVFFRGEERGGQGSKWLSKNMPELFDDIDRAIAFDRADYYDVITHQAGGRCCSNEFAQDLANHLSTESSWYLPCSGGVYTDTAEFTDIIPECTNLSVGYKHQHGDMEWLDVEFASALCQRCLVVPWDTLVTKRDPKVIESTYAGYGMYSDYYDYYDKDWYKDYKKSDGVYRGTVLEDLPGDDEVEPVTPDTEDEMDLMYAIEDALYEQENRYVLELIAAHVCPDHPNTALNQMDRRKLDDTVLSIGMDMLQEGWAAHHVLEEMFEMVAKA